MTQFILTNIDTGTVDFILNYNPESAVPFIIISGEPDHVFNWNLIDGGLIMDGTQLTIYTITIENL